MTRKKCPKCGADPRKGEITAELFCSLGHALMSGQMPGARDNVRDAATWVILRMLEIWFARSHPLAQEIDHLLEALGNKEDPIVRDLDVMDAQAVWSLVNTLRQMRPTNEAANRDEG